MKDIKKVLVLMPDKHMGNLVVSLPAIKALRDLFRNRKLFLVVDSSYAEIAQTLDWVDSVILYPRKELKRSTAIKRISLLSGFSRDVRRISADVTIDLDGRQVSAIMTLISGAPLRVGRATADMPYFYNYKVSTTEGRHKVYTYLNIASALGADTDNVEFVPNIPDEKQILVKNILEKANISLDRPIVCIHPGAGKFYKQWTSSGFARISDWLTSEGYQAVFVGNGSDTKKIQEVFSELKRPAFDLANKLSLGDLMALFDLSALYLGNDSGPMHLADRAGIPLVALFGPADEKRWGPLSKRSAVVRGEKPCAKCKGKDCQYDLKCIRTLSDETVKGAVLKVLSRREAP